MKNTFIKNKQGSMMLEYMIITVVGLIVLGSFVLFLGEGKILIENSVKKYKSISTTDDKNLGKFK